MHLSFHGEVASQSAGVSQTGLRQGDSGHETEGYDWPERKTLGTRLMGEQITSRVVWVVVWVLRQLFSVEQHFT